MSGGDAGRAAGTGGSGPVPRAVPVPVPGSRSGLSGFVSIVGGAGPVVCVGETMAALAPDPAAPLESADALAVFTAGAESNVAQYLADLGVPVRWVSALGDDPFGRRVRAEVAAAGVDVTGVRADPHRPTGLLLKDPRPEGSRVHYYRRDSAAAALGPALLREPALRGAGLLHLTGITPALSASCRALVEAALEPERGARPCPVSFDVNHRPALWRDAERPAAEVLAPLADRADVVFVGLDEAEGLWWRGEAAEPADVRALLPGPPVLVVKDGPRAATCFVGPDAHTVPALRVRVVEPVGAGDAFAAGFLAGLRGTGDPVRALRLGHVTAASALRVTSDRGPLPAPDRIAALLDADDAGWRQEAVA